MKSLDLFGWLDRNEATPEPADVAHPQSPGGLSVSGYGGRLGKYAAAALEKEAAAVATATVGGRNHALNRASLALGELIAGGELTRAEVETTLGIAARSIGMDDHEITATMASGIEAGMRQPRNLNHVGNGGKPPGKPPKDGGGGPPGPDPDEYETKAGYEDNPHELAKLFRGQHYRNADGWKIRYWADEFHVWQNGSYRPTPAKEVRAKIAETVAAEFDRLYDLQVVAAGMAKDEDKAKSPRPIPVTTNLVGHIMQALGGMSLLPRGDYPDQPCWIDGEAGWPVAECVPMANAIVHLPSFAAGLPCTRRPTPRFFCPYRLTYDFDPDAPQPARWLGFLREVWPDDQESIDTLQEWFGLQLVPDTSHQKIMGLIGPPGSGKGTIIRTQQSMIGNNNCASIRFSRFEKDYALTSVIGKLSLVIPDGRISSKADQAAILEAILSISGEDCIEIERKYIDSWKGKLSARITLVSNDLPRFSDASSALSRRFVLLKFRNSFEGREDKSMEPEIMGELPGIFRWAVEGWKRLRTRGYFIQPETGVGEMEMLRELASPVSMFLDECCVLGSDETEPCAAVFAAWRAWCEANGHQPGTSAVFGRNLHSALPSLVTRQKRAASGKTRVYEGLGLKSVAEFAGAGIASGEGGFTFDDTPRTPFD